MKRALDLGFLGGLALVYLGLGWALERIQSEAAHLIGLVSYGGGALCLVGVLLRCIGLINLDLVFPARTSDEPDA